MTSSEGTLWLLAEFGGLSAAQHSPPRWMKEAGRQLTIGRVRLAVMMKPVEATLHLLPHGTPMTWCAPIWPPLLAGSPRMHCTMHCSCRPVHSSPPASPLAMTSSEGPSAASWSRWHGSGEWQQNPIVLVAIFGQAVLHRTPHHRWAALAVLASPCMVRTAPYLGGPGTTMAG